MGIDGLWTMVGGIVFLILFAGAGYAVYKVRKNRKAVNEKISAEAEQVAEYLRDAEQKLKERLERNG